MIPLIEDYLSELIEAKLSYLKTDSSYIDKILSTSQAKLDRLKAYLQVKPVRVVKGYPRTPDQLPCICILLSNENEEQSGLGDVAEYDDEDIREYTEQVQVIDVRGGRLAVPYIQLSRTPVTAVTQVLNLDLGTYLNPSEYLLDNPDLGITGFYTGNVEDGDNLSVTYTYKAQGTENMEVMYDSNYRMEVWADNGDLAVELYHLLKWALLSGRGDLVGKGLVIQKLGGTDFDPAPEYFPSFVYRRAMTMWCKYTVSTPGNTYDYIGTVQVEESVSIDIGGDD